VLRSDGFSDRFLQVSSPTIGAAALKPGGLAQVYGLARQSGGGLRIKSSVGQGTTAEVYLPRSFAQGETGIEWWDNERPRALGNRATVLVVNDQEDVREVTVAHLAPPLRNRWFARLSAGGKWIRTLGPARSLASNEAFYITGSNHTSTPADSDEVAR
jgi:hypothetical protein